MEFALNPISGQVFSERTAEEIGNYLNNNPISGGVVQDSSGNILDRDVTPDFGQLYNYEKEKNYRSPQETANEILNDVVRGETSNLESSKDYLERITGIIANGIYTAKEQNALNLAEAEKVRQYNASEAEKARAFQMMLRDTQIQSTLKQLKDNGINPLLALSGSLGYANASSPAQASSSHTTFGNDNSIMSALIIAVASALGSLTKILGIAF